MSKDNFRREACDGDKNISSPNPNTKATSTTWTDFSSHATGEVLSSVYGDDTFAHLR
jgi:hypothetical protein